MKFFRRRLFLSLRRIDRSLFPARRNAITGYNLVQDLLAGKHELLRHIVCQRFLAVFLAPRELVI